MDNKLTPSVPETKKQGRQWEFRPIACGPLKNLLEVSRYQRRLLRAMSRGKISVVDGGRLMAASRILVRTLESRDVEKAVEEARQILGEVKKLRNQ